MESFNDRVEAAKIVINSGNDAIIEYLRGGTETCICGKGDDAPAIAHSDECPCIDWVFGQLEGD